MLGRLSVGQKLATAGLLLGIPFVGLLGWEINKANQSVTQVNAQQAGQAMLLPLTEILQNAQLLRLSSVNVLNGTAGAKETNAKQRATMTAALDSLEGLMNKADYVELVGEITQMRETIGALNRRVDTRRAETVDVQQEYTKLLKNVVTPLFADIANRSGLKRTDDIAQTELADLVTNTMPRNMPLAGAIASGTIPLLTRAGKLGSPISDSIRTEAQLRYETAKAASDDILAGYSRTLQQVDALGSDLTDQLSAAQDNLKKSSDAIFNAVDFGLLLPERTGVTPGQLTGLVPAFAAGLFGGLNDSIKTLGTILDSEAAQRSAQVRNLILALLAGTLLLIALLVLIARSITEPLGVLTAASRRLADGQLDVQVPITSRDELGVVGQAFNAATATLRVNQEKTEQDRLESQRLQTHVAEFLDVTMDIAGGDLTRRGLVTEDVLGNVVDSINLMTDELATVLAGVKRASASVTDGSQAMLESTEQIRQGTLITTEETGRVTRQAQEMTVAIRQMSAIAQASADSAQRSLSASETGQQAVTSTLAGMEAIRESSRSVSGRVQSLTQRAEQIEEIVDSISHIASQVNLLSLHASIEAAGAGESGKRFAVVAEEIRELADLSTDATARIAGLIAEIQGDVRGVAQEMKSNSAQVEQGYLVAGQAGEALREIGELAGVTAHFAQNISDAARTQAQEVQSMSGAVGQIAAVAQQSQQSAEAGRAVAEQLQALATRLGSSLTRFRLPG